MRIKPLQIIAAAALVSAAQAGIPQPGIVLYGQVRDSNGLITEGTLQWTYQPQSAPPVTVKVPLRLYAGANNQTYSYRLQIPIQQALLGDSSSSGSLTFFGAGGLAITRSATLNGDKVYIDRSATGDTAVLSLTDSMGSVERVDLKVLTPADCCPGDANGDEFVTLADYASVRENFGDPFPIAGDADCNLFVNAFDYLAVRDSIGTGCSSTRRSLFVAAPLDSDYLMAVEAKPANAAVGQQLTADISINTDGKSLSTVGAVITYDSSDLEFMGGQIDPVFDDLSRTSTPRLAEPGKIIITAGSTVDVSGTIFVGSLRFTTLAAGDSDLGFDSSGSFVPSVLDGEWNEWTIQTSPASVTVQPLTNVKEWESHSY